MFDEEFRIAVLVAAWLRGQLTEKQQLELDAWLEASAENRKFFNGLISEQQFSIDLHDFAAADKGKLWRKTKDKIAAAELVQRAEPVKLYPLLYKTAIAAILLLVAGAGIWFYISKTSDIAEHKAQLSQNNIPPGRNTATLTLANGKKIVLSSAMNGELAKESGISISKTVDGQLVYEIKNQKGKPMHQFNTLSTARGETYQVRLPDGSLVALNAASSLTYATTLNERGQRWTKLVGEAYFEIVKDKRHPFIVVANKQEVEVLGTHFNINSYNDEPDVKTTLMEGSVRVTSKINTASSLVLKPGQQSLLDNHAGFDVREVQPQTEIDWKQGKFVFENEALDVILRKVARWYDVEIVYQGNNIPKANFTGVVSRFENVSKVLSKLELTNEVRFEIRGKKIFVR